MESTKSGGTRRTFTVGQEVSAFHPAKVGVMHVGEVKVVGRKYLHIDFGELLGGVWRVPYSHVQ